MYIKICFESGGFKAYLNEWDEREKTMFIHTNQPLITSFYTKKVSIFAELAMSQRCSAIFCATGVWGGKSIGRVRVKLFSYFQIWTWNLKFVSRCHDQPPKFSFIHLVAGSAPLELISSSFKHASYILLSSFSKGTTWSLVPSRRWRTS